MENELSYKIKGIKLDNNPCIHDKQHKQLILWRTSKSIQQVVNLISRCKKTISSNLIESKNFRTNNITYKIAQMLVKSRNEKAKQSKRLLKLLQNGKTSPKICINIYACANEDWVESYKESIKPILCGGFYIRASWHEENKDYKNIIIDPSLSFGSGHHATTLMCIDFLEKLGISGKSMLDVGCGTGILSMIGASLGAEVDACDTDSNSYEQSLINFTRNSLQYGRLWEGSIDLAGNREYDIICANIVASVIMSLSEKLTQLLKVGGVLIISGILEKDIGKILQTFSDLHILEKKQLSEWIGLKFIKK